MPVDKVMYLGFEKLLPMAKKAIKKIKKNKAGKEMKIKNEKGSVIQQNFKDNKYCWLAFDARQL